MSLNKTIFNKDIDYYINLFAVILLGLPLGWQLDWAGNLLNAGVRFQYKSN